MNLLPEMAPKHALECELTDPPKGKGCLAKDTCGVCAGVSYGLVAEGRPVRTVS